MAHLGARSSKEESQTFYYFVGRYHLNCLSPVWVVYYTIVCYLLFTLYSNFFHAAVVSAVIGFIGDQINRTAEFSGTASKTAYSGILGFEIEYFSGQWTWLPYHNSTPINFSFLKKGFFSCLLAAHAFNFAVLNLYWLGSRSSNKSESHRKVSSS